MNEMNEIIHSFMQDVLHAHCRGASAVTRQAGSRGRRTAAGGLVAVRGGHAGGQALRLVLGHQVAHVRQPRRIVMHGPARTSSAAAGYLFAASGTVHTRGNRPCQTRLRGPLYAPTLRSRGGAATPRGASSKEAPRVPYYP